MDGAGRSRRGDEMARAMVAVVGPGLCCLCLWAVQGMMAAGEPAW